MWYAIVTEDVADSLELRRRTRQSHLERMKPLVDQGRVLVAGPFPAIDAEDPESAGFTGSLIIVDFPSLDEAREWAEADPYVSAGVYAKVVVKPFRKVLP